MDEIKKTIYLFMVGNCCINNMLRFNINKEEKFNQSFGNGKFSNKFEMFWDSINYCNTKDIEIKSISFKNLLKEINNNGNFLFIDLPYLNTSAAYNNLYNKDDFNYLINYLENTDNKFLYTDIYSDKLFNIVQKNNWEYKILEKIRNNSPNRKKENIHKELFVWNFKYNDFIINFS
jgi:hypothetical protein